MVAKSASNSLMVVGGQWGDEGKGKIVDLLSEGFSAVVRYNGGHNAGHTVRVGEERFALHLVPSGIIHPDVSCLMGAGMVIDPTALRTEIELLAEKGILADGRLHLSPRAALLLPTHRALDLAREGQRGASKIGTTGRGIGPAYQDSAQRRGLRTGLLSDPAGLSRAGRILMEQHNQELTTLYGADAVDLDEAEKELLEAAESLAPFLREIGPEIRRHEREGGAILFEGAQGVLLDVIWGTYPFVTSSSCLPGSAAASCGVGPAHLGPVVGVFKAYATRVGSGPFPTEDHGADGDLLRDLGAEYGTTTGRPRRCGWFDVVAAKHAVDTAGIDAVALTKMDILDGVDTLKVALAYETEAGEMIETFPADVEILEEVRPVYTELESWSSVTAGLVNEDDLPSAAEDYLQFLEARLGIPVALVSTGPRRDETMVRGGSEMAGILGKILNRP